MVVYTNLIIKSDGTFDIDVECFMCKTVKTINLTDEEFTSYFVEHMHIQYAMPERSKEFREFLILGTCEDCWNEMFGKERK